MIVSYFVFLVVNGYRSGVSSLREVTERNNAGNILEFIRTYVLFILL